jgi:hypothetical protein
MADDFSGLFDPNVSGVSILDELAGAKQLYPPTPVPNPPGMIPVGGGDNIPPVPPQLPPVTPPMPTAGIPDAIAAKAAGAGIPPPANAAGLPSWRDQLSPDVGAALTGGAPAGGVPMPTPRAIGPSAPGAPLDITPPAATAAAAAAAAPAKADKFAEALRGVKMPANPVVPQVSTPALPKSGGTIKSGNLLQLLQTLNATPQGTGVLPTSSLGRLLGR